MTKTGNFYSSTTHPVGRKIVEIANEYNIKSRQFVEYSGFVHHRLNRLMRGDIQWRVNDLAFVCSCFEDLTEGAIDGLTLFMKFYRTYTGPSNMYRLIDVPQVGPVLRMKASTHMSRYILDTCKANRVSCVMLVIMGQYVYGDTFEDRRARRVLNRQALKMKDIPWLSAVITQHGPIDDTTFLQGLYDTAINGYTGGVK